MPSKNTIREDADDIYYHVYNRCISDANLFRDDIDYKFFLSLLKRYLQQEKSINKTNKTLYESYYGKVELLAFCLMPTHFHLLSHQVELGAVASLMKAISNSYTKYYNNKYQRRGPIFQGVYKSSRIATDEYLTHVSRYIHLNARDYNDWAWSSLPYFKGNSRADWVRPQFILGLFRNSRDEYLEFVADYEAMHEYLEKLHHELADEAESVWEADNTTPTISGLT
jgi:putative transposase